MILKCKSKTKETERVKRKFFPYFSFVCNEIESRRDGKRKIAEWKKVERK